MQCRFWQVWRDGQSTSYGNVACLVMRFMCPDVFHVLRALNSGLMMRLTVLVANPAVMDGVAEGGSGKECSARRQHQGHRPPRGQ
eukprot:549227-Alexandrium_andersonii.AAC.1